MREFFDQNETLILFAQGLVFFALGFAVWLQRRRATRLRLTSSLIWLAAFAFVEGLAVWGYVFVPIQETYLDAGVIDGLLVLRALLQGIAFLFLVQFGLRLLDIGEGLRRAWGAASVAAWAAILVLSTLAAGSAGWTTAEWESSVEALARYALLLPGALLAAYGLWRQRDELGAAGMTGIRPYAAGAAAVLVVYALVAGLVVEPAPWAQAHAGSWRDLLGVPVELARALAGFALCVFAVKLLEIFEVEAKQRIDDLERERTVAEERARFRRDLHDGTIQAIYAAGLHLEAIAIRSTDPAVRSEAREVVADLNAVTDGIRDYICDLAAPMPRAEEIAERLRGVAAHFAGESGIPVEFDSRGAARCGPLPDQAGQHLEQVLREGLANVARHAGPCHARVLLSFAEDELELVICDDGNGPRQPAVEAERTGHGLRNMRERARRLGGRLTFGTDDSGGARLALSVPLDSDVPAAEQADQTTTTEVSAR